jgi:fermentation-respiration switch protein FrsA (DUF1100 family)
MSTPTNVVRRNISFKTIDGVVLRGWHFLPRTVNGKVATIVMTHGFGGVKEMYLDDFAAAFAAAGFGAIVYDNRGLGESDGEPRQEVDPWRQLSDMRDAITYAQALPETDPNLIGLWGSSFSGGHAIVTAANDRRVKCVVAQVPFISGYHTSRRYTRADLAESALAMIDADRAARFRGEAPMMLPISPPALGEPAVMPSRESYEFTAESSKRAPTFRNEVTLRSMDLAGGYEPGFYIERVSPTPLLMIIGTKDVECHYEIGLAAYERALQPKKLVTVKGGHFVCYVKEFELASSEAVAWFKAHLLSG